MEIGSWGGGHHVQGLHVGAVVLALVCLHHLVRVTAKQVTISNEAGERQEEQYVDIFILKKLRVLWTKLRILWFFLPGVGSAPQVLVPDCNLTLS